ncbi:MAG: ribokinase, partial [Candidatus Ornithospirochaeta sp.]
MKKILVFGSLNIDIVYSLDHIVRPGETIQSLGIEKNPGGKGLNQAIAMAKTGMKVYMAGKVGRDGKTLTDTLSSFGVDTSNVIVSSSTPTGNAIIQRGKDGENSIILSAGTNREIGDDMVGKVLSSFSQGDILVLQNEINNLALIISKAKEKGMYVVLNPAPFDSGVLSLPLGLVDLIVVNEIEGAAMAALDEGSACHTILSVLSRKYPGKEIILTCGKSGAYYRCGDKEVYSPSVETTAVDTTAAGDTFIGYFIASRERGYSVEKAMEYASRASGITVSRKGA